MPSKSLRSSKTLDVPYRKQVLANSCFPCCVRMVLAYYGDDVDERLLYKKAKLPGHKGAWDVKIGPFLIKKGYNVTTYWDGEIGDWGNAKLLKHAHLKAYKYAIKSCGLKHKKGASLELIKKLISKGIPVLTEVSQNKFYNEKLAGTHMVVVIGFDKTGFYLHDPSEGEKIKIHYRKFRDCWEKIQGNAGRSMVVIEK